MTACDNLLDGEQRETLLTDLPAGAAVFKSAHTLLVVDRVFFLMLREAESGGVISPAEAERLIAVSLGALSASGRQEAEEEHGLAGRLRPLRVLREIHGRKAGMLFTAPLAAPKALGDIGTGRRFSEISRGLHRFGLGVQILDDLNDLGQDLAGRRQNYFASVIAHGSDPRERSRLVALEGVEAARRNTGLWKQFPQGLARTQAECLTHFRAGIDLLAAAACLWAPRSGRPSQPDWRPWSITRRSPCVCERDSRYLVIRRSVREMRGQTTTKATFALRRATPPEFLNIPD